jgi:flavin-dependent dehydrogenase
MSVPQPEHTDIIVIGGGPGGSTAAALLARQGFNVTLLERERFPHEHVGESLLPASMPILQDLGVLEQVESAGFPKKYGATMLWGSDPEPWSWYFRETNRTWPHAYQVWRPTFDKILLDNARANGVRVLEQCAVTGPILDGDTITGVEYRKPDGTTAAIHADWTIDASGQAAILGRALQLRQWDDYFRNMAVYTYFRGASRLPDPDAANNIFIESYAHGWTWNIPLADDTASVGIVVDSELGQRGISDLGVSDYYADQLQSATRTASMVSDAHMIAPPRVIKDWSYTSERMIGDGWILVGDASCFIDPLFSSGVHLAMMSAVMAAAYVHAVHTDSTMHQPAARLYQQLYRKEYGHFRELARLFYASNRTVESYFWEARRIIGDDDRESRRSFIRAVAGQAPRGYERAVLDKGHLPTDLTRAIQEIESARIQRSHDFDHIPLHNAIPRLAEGARLEKGLTFADDQFQWSPLLITPDRPEGAPISQLVTALVSCIDGRHTTTQILKRLTTGIESADQRKLATEAITASLRILHTEGAVTITF